MIELLIALDSRGSKASIEKPPLLLHINSKFISLIKAKHAGWSSLALDDSSTVGKRSIVDQRVPSS
jgi:hypothetical protein